jgi:hypothetical protein
MRLVWTAIVPRSLVESSDAKELGQCTEQILDVTPHVNPDLRIVRCYRR